MMNSLETVALLSDRDLLARTHELVDRSCCTEADLLVHLGEVDERKLYLERAFPFGRCTFLDERGRRCPATGYLQFDHEDGFALTHLHDGDRIRLLCRAHNQHAAEKTYGRAFMERARSLRVSTCSGTGRDASEENKRQLPLLEHPTP